MPRPHTEPRPADADLTPDAARRSRELAEKLSVQQELVERLFGTCTDATLTEFIGLGLAEAFSNRWNDPEFRDRLRTDRAGTIAALVTEYGPRTQH